MDGLQASKTQGVTNAHAAVAFVVGFTGQLKPWWDNILTQEMRDEILNHKSITRTSGMEVEKEDAVEILSHTLTLHFIRNPKEEQAAAKTILINLCCPTLTDYRWYKDVFLTNVHKREDGLQDLWKERFIAGLPRLFGERILSKLRQNFGTNDILFGLLTFGQLFGIVKTEGLSLCNEIKIQSKYGNERAQSR